MKLFVGGKQLTKSEFNPNTVYNQTFEKWSVWVFFIEYIINHLTLPLQEPKTIMSLPFRNLSRMHIKQVCKNRNGLIFRFLFSFHFISFRYTKISTHLSRTWILPYTQMILNHWPLYFSSNFYQTFNDLWSVLSWIFD